MPAFEMIEAPGMASVERNGADGPASLITSVFGSLASAVSMTL